MTTPTNRMLDLAFFRTGSLRDILPGALFVPAAKDGQHFIGGRLNDFPVLVSLEGDEPFKVTAAEQSPPSSGLIVRRVRFQVDKASAIEIRNPQDAPQGALLLSPLGTVIVAHDHNGPKAVLLGGGVGSTDMDGTGAIAFTVWQIVAENEAAVVMYRSPPMTL